MTNAEAWRHADNMCKHFSKLKTAIETKGKDAKRAVDHGLSESATTEIAGKSDAIILALSSPKSDTNPNGIPSEQDAIDSLKPEEEVV